MIVDTSALIALHLGERDAPLVALAIHRAKHPRMSAATRVESELVASRHGPGAVRVLRELIERTRITVEPFTPRQAEIACTAHRDFGRGSGSKARLNFGDCMTYALAKDLDEPLLFVGDDFRHTDVRVAELPT